MIVVIYISAMNEVPQLLIEVEKGHLSADRSRLLEINWC